MKQRPLIDPFVPPEFDFSSERKVAYSRGDLVLECPSATHAGRIETFLENLSDIFSAAGVACVLQNGLLLVGFSFDQIGDSTRARLSLALDDVAKLARIDFDEKVAVWEVTQAGSSSIIPARFAAGEKRSGYFAQALCEQGAVQVAPLGDPFAIFSGLELTAR